MFAHTKTKSNRWISSTEKAQEESEAREMSILYGCQEGLVAMHKAGLTLSAAMAQLIQVGCDRTTTVNTTIYDLLRKQQSLRKDPDEVVERSSSRYSSSSNDSGEPDHQNGRRRD